MVKAAVSRPSSPAHRFLRDYLLKACARCGDRITHGPAIKRFCSQRCQVNAWKTTEKGRLTSRRMLERWINRNPDRWKQLRNKARKAFDIRHRDRENKRKNKLRDDKTKTLRLLKFQWNIDRISSEMETVMKDNETLATHNKAVKKLTSKQLQTELAKGLSLVRDRLLRLAAVVAELDSRGEVVPGDAGVLNMLRKVAAGQLLVDVVIRFAGQPQVIGRVGRMSASEQADLLKESDETIGKRFGKPKNNPNGGLSVQRSLREMAEAGTPKDVADACLELVEHSRDPATVAAIVVQGVSRWLKSSKAG